MSIIRKFGEGLLSYLRDTTAVYSNTATGNTIMQASKPAQVSPITLISSDLTSTKELYDILHSVLNIYSAYYLQVMELLSASLSDARILKTLDALNPNRDLDTYMATLSRESSDDHITSKVTPDEEMLFNYKRYLALEGLQFSFKNAKSVQLANETLALSTVKTPKGKIDSVNSFEKFEKTVGKIVEITFNAVNGNESNIIKIPVVIKLDNMIVDSLIIKTLLTNTKDKISLGSRFKAAMGGRISWLSDFLLCSDLIKNQKKISMNDTSGAINKVLGSIANNKFYSIISNNLSLNTISAILVISEAEEEFIKQEIGGDLSNKNTRDIVFASSNTAMIIALDRDWERVSIYIRGFDNYSEIPFSSFKKDGGGLSDLTDLIKELSIGKTPKF